MTVSARSLAVDILNRIDKEGIFAEALLDRTLSRGALTEAHERRLLTELVYGTLRMRGLIDWVIARFYKRNPLEMDDAVRNILRTALYQLFFTDRIPAFAVVDEAVKLAKKTHPAASGLTNAVLRNVLRQKEAIAWPDFSEDPLSHIAVVHSHPRWLVERWIGLFGLAETEGFCRANNSIAPQCLRVNRLRVSREAVIRQLRSEEFVAEETHFSPDGVVLRHAPKTLRETLSFRQGHIQPQDEASQLAALLLAPQPGEQILDACAGAGIKTTYLAEMMQNTGAITAVDLSERKLAALCVNAQRLGVDILTTRVLDMSLGATAGLKAACDGVLLDVPCSGLGTLRRNPEIKWRIVADDLQHIADLQKKLLSCAAECVRPGGRLVYVTCSVMPEENEDIIADFLFRRVDFRRSQLPAAIPVSMISTEGCFKTRPDRHGTDGFFGAVLKRNG